MRQAIDIQSALAGTWVAHHSEERIKPSHPQQKRAHAWPGSVVYETAASTHTPEVVSTEGAGGYVVMLVQMTGDLAFLDEQDNIVALENWKTALQRYRAYCEQHGIKPKDLTAFN